LFPETVNIADGKYGVAYDELTVIGIKGIQEQQKQLEQLSKQLDDIISKNRLDLIIIIHNSNSQLTIHNHNSHSRFTIHNSQLTTHNSQLTTMEATLTKTLFERIGGMAAVNAAVDIFYNKVIEDDRISHFFRHIDMKVQSGKLKGFMAYAFGAPMQYSGKSMRELIDICN
jgi:hypothetical protein